MYVTIVKIQRIDTNARTHAHARTHGHARTHARTHTHTHRETVVCQDNGTEGDFLKKFLTRKVLKEHLKELTGRNIIITITIIIVIAINNNNNNNYAHL